MQLSDCSGRVTSPPVTRDRSPRDASHQIITVTGTLSPPLSRQHLSILAVLCGGSFLCCDILARGPRLQQNKKWIRGKWIIFSRVKIKIITLTLLTRASWYRTQILRFVMKMFWVVTSYTLVTASYYVTAYSSNSFLLTPLTAASSCSRLLIRANICCNTQHYSRCCFWHSIGGAYLSM